MENKMSLFEKIFYYTILTVVALFTLLPIVYTIMGAFKTNMEIMTHPERLFPEAFTLENFKTAWNSESFNVGRMTVYSLIYTIFCVCVDLITVSMAGYTFARGDFYGKKIVFTVLTALMFINLGGITVYPTFEVMDVFHIPRSLWGLMITKIFAIKIVQIHLVRSYIVSLPTAMDESAEIDGCSFIGIFFRIIAPLLKPILATVAILSFQASWNDYLMPTIFTMSNPEQRTLIVGVMALKNSEAASTSWNLMLAGATISMFPVLVAYAIANKQFVSGLASGAVKG